MTRASSTAAKKTSPTPNIPKAGERWEFKFKRDSGSIGYTQDYPPVTVIDVTEGWVRYAIGKSHPDLQKSLATFTYMYSRAGR